MRQGTMSVAILAGLLVTSAPLRADEPDWPSMEYTLHSAYQVVDGNGQGIFPLDEAVKMRGVIINWPHDMLDGAPGAPGYMGGLWQTYVQATEVDDFGGTACWMGQYMGKIIPGNSYTDQEWLAELDRLNHDPMTERRFRTGDLVEVRARGPGLPYHGKTNINETHNKNPDFDFDVVLLEAGYGVPEPELITLADVKDDENEFIFDQTRTIGAEHYQATLVRINGVSFVDDSNWGPEGELEIQDGTGHTMPVLLGRGRGFSRFGAPAPAVPFDLVGLFDQEDADGGDGYKQDYRVWVMDYNGTDFIVERAVSVVEWSSVRTHGQEEASQDLAITLDHASDCGTSEPRMGGVQRIEVDFDNHVGIVVDAIQAEDLTGGGFVDADDAYLINDGTTLVIEFSGLEDVKCYRIELADKLDADVVEDSDCRFVNLVGDIDGDFDVRLTDALRAKDDNAKPVADHLRSDVDADNNITLTDFLLTKDRNANAVVCPDCD